VKERGLHRVDYEDVFPPISSPRPRGFPASSLRLSRQGRDVAFHMEPAGAPFGPGSSLYFLSEGSSLSPYADAVYELETNARGLAMARGRLSLRRRGRSGSTGDGAEGREPHYQSAPGRADLWQWDIVVSPGSKPFLAA
jgi:hypothetical protein